MSYGRRPPGLREASRIRQSTASSMTRPVIWPMDDGDESPTFRERNHCLGQRRNVVRPEAESRERLRPRGPPFGGTPTGMLSPHVGGL